jgi:predicted lactoylglutathione lyase
MVTIMSNTSKLASTLLLLLIACGSVAADDEGKQPGSAFTGEVLTQLYVTDVRKSVAFYKALGFHHDYYYDYETGASVLEWTQSYPPEYAEMKYGTIRLAMTTSETPDQVLGGGVRHYFLVEDVTRNYEMVKNNGVTPVPDEVEVRPWMSFITIPDPDNHQIILGTKNQVYYDAARDRIDALKNSE